jgi:hypothetical protein
MTRKRTKQKHKRTTKNNKTYSKQDYESSDGFLTAVWGPMLWSYLHTMSFNYPNNPTPENKVHYREFVLNLQYVMPCKFCRINLTKNLKDFPLTLNHMKDRESFSRYIYGLHETINRMLNKKSGLSYDDVRNRYENFRSRCTTDPSLPPPIPMKENKKGKEKEKEKEKGCTVPLYGKKSRCVIKIIPQEEKQETFQIDKKCVKHK